MKSTFHRLAAAGALCLGLAATAAIAQDGPPGPGGPPASRGPGDRGPGDRGPGDRALGGEKLFAEMKQRREQRLHDLLQIKPDQEGAFRAFLTALDQARPQRGPDGQKRGERGPDGKGAGPRGPGPGPEARLTTPERLDRMNQEMTRRMAERQQRLQKTTAAVKTFYAVLSPEQRKAFDELPVLRVGGFEDGPEHGPEGGPGRGQVVRRLFQFQDRPPEPR